MYKVLGLWAVPGNYQTWSGDCRNPRICNQPSRSAGGLGPHLWLLSEVGAVLQDYLKLVSELTWIVTPRWCQRIWELVVWNTSHSAPYFGGSLGFVSQTSSCKSWDSWRPQLWISSQVPFHLFSEDFPDTLAYSVCVLKRCLCFVVFAYAAFLVIIQ